MRKILISIALLCLPVASLAETYVCDAHAATLDAYERTDTGFLLRNSSGYIVPENLYSIIEETDTWLFLLQFILWPGEISFSITSMSINKETLKYTYHFVAGSADSAKLIHPPTGREI